MNTTIFIDIAQSIAIVLLSLATINLSKRK